MAGNIGPEPGHSRNIQPSVDFAHAQQAHETFTQNVKGAPRPTATDAISGAGSNHEDLFGLTKAKQSYAGFPELAVKLMGLMKAEGLIPSLGTVNIKDIQTTLDRHVAKQDDHSPQAEKILEASRKEAKALETFLEVYGEQSKTALDIHKKRIALQQG